MTPTLYQLTICNSMGQPLTEPKSITSVQWAMRVNEVGAIQATLPAAIVPQGLDVDYQLLLERQVSGGNLYLENEAPWLTQAWDDQRNEQGHAITINAEDAKTLLNRRINAYASGTANASASATPADNIMKSIVRANMGSTAITARRWDTTATIPTLTVEANTSQGYTTSKAYAWRNPILPVLQELADDSAQNGTYLAFDIVKTLAGLEFRTYKNQRGTNRSISGGFSPTIFSPQLGNLIDCKLTTDYRNMLTYVYVGGQGQESNRAIREVADTTGLLNKSPFGRREGFRDARQTDNNTALDAEGYAWLREHRPRRIFTAKVVQTPSTLYGRDYFLGDIITVDYYGLVFDCRIDMVNGRVENNVETIDISLQSVLNVI